MQVYSPSGLVLAARPWKLGDHATLIEARDQVMALLPLTMAKLAVTEVIDPGPYPFKAGEPPNWDMVSLADITVINIMIRAGKDPIFVLQPLCAQCRKIQRGQQEVDLLELPIFEASPEGLEHLGNDVPISLDVPVQTDEQALDVVSVKLKAIRGRDLHAMGKLQSQEPEHMLELMTCMGIAEIKPPKSKKVFTTLPDIRGFFREQEWRFRDVIEERLDTLFGGADLRYRFSCDHMGCSAEQEQAVPLDLSFYGLDLQTRLSKRAKASSGKSVRELMQRGSSRSSRKSPTSQGTT